MRVHAAGHGWFGSVLLLSFLLTGSCMPVLDDHISASSIAVTDPVLELLASEELPHGRSDRGTKLLQGTAADTQHQSCGDGGKCKWYLAVLGAVIACIASACSALANVLLRWSHVNEAARPKSEQRRMFARLHTYPIFALYGLNGLIDSAAYTLAPISLLAPTSALTIVVNAIAARAILGEVMTRTDACGTAIIFTGAILCTVFGSKRSERYSADELRELYTHPAFVNFTICHSSLLAVCLVCSLLVFPRLLKVRGPSYDDGKKSEMLLDEDKCYEAPDLSEVRGQEGGVRKAASAEEKEAAKEEKKKQNEQEVRALRTANTWSYALWGITSATLTAGVVAWTNLLLKSVIEMVAVSMRGDNQLKKFSFWLLTSSLVVCALLQIVFVSKMLDRFEALFIVPMFQSLVIVFLIVSGGTYFDEWRGMKVWEIALFCTGCVVCLVGIVVMAGQGGKKQEEATEDLKVKR